MSPSRFDHLPNLATIPAPVPPERNKGIVDVNEDTIADRDVVERAREYTRGLCSTARAGAAAVDVLALVREQAEYHPEAVGSGINWEAAAAALAELILANKEYDDANSAFGRAPSMEACERFLAADKRRAAALARVQGGAA